MPENDTSASSDQDFGCDWPEVVEDPLGDALRDVERLRAGNLHLVGEIYALRRRLRGAVYYGAAVTAVLTLVVWLVLSGRL